MQAEPGGEGAVSQWLPSGHKRAVHCVAPSEAGGPALLASAAEDGTVRVWDAERLKPVRVLQKGWLSGGEASAPAAAVLDVAWAGGGNELFVTRGDTLSVVDLRDPVGRAIIREAATVYNAASDLEALLACPAHHNAQAPGLLAFGTEEGQVGTLAFGGAGAAPRAAVRKPHANLVVGVGFHSVTPGGARVWSAAMDATVSLATFPHGEASELSERPEDAGVVSPLAQVNLGAKGKLLNPPLPTCLSTSAGGDAAIGLMNGTVAVYSALVEPGQAPEIEATASWVCLEDVPIEAVSWSTPCTLWTADRAGRVSLWALGVDDGEEDDDAAGGEPERGSLLTALQCPASVTALATPSWLSPVSVFTGDRDGNIGLHTLPLFA
ncbi:hypothetical protein DIPPA_35132 [Diplonema papillatum]|nr:hypothetical protein DIPPA_35132 [Diplonema papillatum]